MLLSNYSQDILEIVNASYDHLTAQDIFLQMKAAGSKAVLATVYNNLNSLCSEKRIRRITVEGGPDHFDRMDRHDHLICTNCGKLSDINFCDLTKSLEKELGTQIEAYDLQVFFTCKDCKNANEKLGKAKERV